MIFDTRDEDSRFAMSAKEECIDEEVRWSGKENTMRQAIGEIRPGLTTHFVTSGTWSCYELLKYALKTTGPAEVDAFTWNISMPAVTQILEMKRDGEGRRSADGEHLQDFCEYASRRQEEGRAAMGCVQGHPGRFLEARFFVVFFALIACNALIWLYITHTAIALASSCAPEWESRRTRKGKGCMT